MGKIKGFMEFDRIKEPAIAPKRRIKDYKEFTVAPKNKELEEQGAMCMDCGGPFCHSGCPLGNLIPDFNDAVYQNDWQKALRILHSTNNFPEFTGRLCPAPCEAACTLNIDDSPVTIKTIECSIIDKAWENNWIHPEIALKKINNQEKEVIVFRLQDFERRGDIYPEKLADILKFKKPKYPHLNLIKKKPKMR